MIEIHQGHITHFFTCSAKQCRSSTGGVQHYQDKADKSLTTNLQHHAAHCWGDNAVNEATKGAAGVSQSGNIFSSFAQQGQNPVTYSHCAHSTPKFQ